MLLPLSNWKRPPLQLVLDESVIYLKDNRGSVLVRGEVIVYLTKDTTIQSPISLTFEGIQRIYPWPGITLQHSPESSIETKMHSIELSLLPPGTQDVIPAGFHRIPFEFPIPASLPTSVFIPGRLDIFYRLTAKLYRSPHAHQQLPFSTQFMDWTHWPLLNKPVQSTADLRLVRAVECLSGITSEEQPSPPYSLPIFQTTPQTGPEDTDSEVTLESWHGCSLPRFTLDEQYDRLACSMAGRTVTSEFRLPKDSENCIEYKLTVDRTAVALGTSIGIEVLIEPKSAPIKVRSIQLHLTESRDYAVQIPGNHGTTQGCAETRRLTEKTKMTLKWAFNHTGIETNTAAKKSSKKTLLKTFFPHSNTYENIHSRSPNLVSSMPAVHDPDLKTQPYWSAHVLGGNKNIQRGKMDNGELMNLKELDHTITADEYFKGRYTMPMPSCQSVLHPSMDYDSIKVQHWLKLAVMVECEGKKATVSLQTPVRLLDCRLVSADDNCQTILPPPPSYEALDDAKKTKTENSGLTFWEQRQAITMGAEWGVCQPCPCLLKRFAKKGEKAPCSSMRSAWGPPPYNPGY